MGTKGQESRSADKAFGSRPFARFKRLAFARGHKYLRRTRDYSQEDFKEGSRARGADARSKHARLPDDSRLKDTASESLAALC